MYDCTINGTLCSVRKHRLIGFFRGCIIAHRRVRITHQVGVKSRKCRATLTFEQINHVLGFVLIEHDLRKPQTPDAFDFFVPWHCEQLVQRVRRILITILIHVEPRHCQFRLCCIGRICIIQRQLIGNKHRIVDIAVGEMICQFLKQHRRFYLRFQFAALVVIPTKQQTSANNDSANNVAAILRPPPTHFLNLFFFRL